MLFGFPDREKESFRRCICCTELRDVPYGFTEYLAPINTHTHIHRAGFLIEYYKLNSRILIFKPLISCRRKGAFACQASNHF